MFFAWNHLWFFNLCLCSYETIDLVNCFQKKNIRKHSCLKLVVFCNTQTYVVHVLVFIRNHWFRICFYMVFIWNHRCLICFSKWNHWFVVLFSKWKHFYKMKSSISVILYMFLIFKFGTIEFVICVRCFVRHHRLSQLCVMCFFV